MMTEKELGDALRQALMVFDGAMGTEIYHRHIFTNRCYDELCLSEPGMIAEIHRSYASAGADVLTTNSFGANRLSLSPFGLAERVEAINLAAARLAREAADQAGRPLLVAGSLGPLHTLGSTRAERIGGLAEQAAALVAGGVDFLLFETLPSPEAAQEARAAVAALSRPVAFVLSHSVPADGDVESAVRHRLVDWSASAGPVPAAIGFNCCVGPDQMLSVVEVAVRWCELPLIIQPNAGAPRNIDHRQLYLCSPEYFTEYARRYVNLGARGVGGCCGTTPEHIREMARAIKPMTKSHVLAPPADTEKAAAVPESPLAERSQLGRKLAAGEWVTAVELTPPRGWDTSQIVARARQCQERGVDVVNIPDGPRAAPRMSPLITAEMILTQAGIEPVLHVCCRDRNYLGLQADLLGSAAAGIRNLLMVTGDPPKLGSYSFASGVFDTDSIGLVSLQKHLNRGLDLGGQKITPPTAAVVGVGADPNALDFDREVRRLREKVAAGADYVTTQPVFDPDALFRFLDAIADLRLPVIAGIWPLASLRNALFMKNEVPGVVVPDRVIARMTQAGTNEEQLATGIAIAREAIAAVRSRVSGVQVSAPFGKVEIALAALE